MENIIQKLYNMQLQEENFLFRCLDQKSLQEEWALYNYLYKNLSDKHKKMFSRYTEMRNVRANAETKAAYEYGFKTASQLFAALLKK